MPRVRSRAIRITLLVAVVLLVGAIGLAVSVIVPFTRFAPIEDGRTLPGGATVVAVGAGQVYLLSGANGRTALIDCGDDPDGAAVRSALEAKNLTLASIEAVFITHAHPDHIGGCGTFTAARLYALAREVPAIEGREVTPSFVSTVTFARPSATGLSVIGLEDGATVSLTGRTVTVFAVPGHTPGSAAYLSNGVLFIGDAAGATPDGTLAPSPWIFNMDGAMSRRSLLTLGARLDRDDVDVQAVATGHSAPGPVQMLQGP